MIYVLVVLVLLGAGFWFLVRQRSGRTSRPIRRLEAEYMRKLALPESEARVVMGEQEARLRSRFPGRERRWYLEKMLYDLERDRH